MSSEPPPISTEERFAFGGRDAIELLASGFRVPGGRFRGERFAAYREVTHLAVGRRSVRVATRRGVISLARSRFAEANGGVAFARALLARISALPDGPQRRAAFARLDLALTGPQPLIGRALALISAALFLAQRALPAFEDAAIYERSLVRAGELWRLVTAQLLHGDVVHLALNAMAVFAIGSLLERAIGRAALLFVAGLAAAGAMLGCWVAGYQEVVGISGVVAGFVGAFAVLELGAPERLPAPMRLPRWLLFGSIALEASSEQWLPLLQPLWAPEVATYAHVGGFLAGGLAGLALLPARRLFVVRAGATGAVLVTALAFAWLGWALARPGDAAARRAQRLLQNAESIGELNNSAWEIATKQRPSAEELEAAERMAERAVALTRRRDPNILDTLAETYFAQGRASEALDAIDEAIALVPGEPYFEEQRRRFSGERAADDRPEPPEDDRGPHFEPSVPGDDAPLELPPGDEVTV